MTPLLALDWGTSSLRGALLDAHGEVLQARHFPRGILTVPAGGFEDVFDACFGDWMTPDTLCLITGMAGSRQGWLEAPYCACPAGFTDVAARLSWLPWLKPGRIAIVPGLCTEDGGVPDVMRGEETQIFGALSLLGLQDGRLVLPGTHSKWARVTGGRVSGFSTWMTGEFYALLSRHSILASSLAEPEDAPLHADAFRRGVAAAAEGAGLLHSAFSVRTLQLFGRMPSAHLPSWLSGLLIGEELKAQNLSPGSEVVVVGSEVLTARYSLALEQLGVKATPIGPAATWRGLRALADSIHQDLALPGAPDAAPRRSSPLAHEPDLSADTP
ncbi:MAG: 2-dehydro-3-deoxygalactonokinase [Polaromonas sp.]|nr:2-dehydro-3-deoxygalactonokinase [Polaromonas sp.]